MAGEEQKKSRTSAKRKFTRAYNRYVETINNKGDIDIVKAKYNNIQTLWVEVQSKHDDFLLAKFPDQEEPGSAEDEKWIGELEEKFEIAQKMRYDYERELQSNYEDVMKVV